MKLVQGILVHPKARSTYFLLIVAKTDEKPRLFSTLTGRPNLALSKINIS